MRKRRELIPSAEPGTRKRRRRCEFRCAFAPITPGQSAARPRRGKPWDRLAFSLSRCPKIRSGRRFPSRPPPNSAFPDPVCRERRTETSPTIRVNFRFARDSPLEGAGFELVWAFPCQVVVFGLMPVLCSEREGPFFIPSPTIRFPERAEGVKGPKR